MKLPEIKDLIGKDKKVYFSFYRDGELWYKIQSGWVCTPVDVHPQPTWFEFPIPTEDMKGALFKAEDKSVFYMRFVRKHLDFLKQSMHSEGIK